MLKLKTDCYTNFLKIIYKPFIRYTFETGIY